MKKTKFCISALLMFTFFFSSSVCLFEKTNATEISNQDKMIRSELLEKPQPVAEDIRENLKVVIYLVYGFFVVITILIMIYGIKTLGIAKKKNDRKERNWALTIIVGDIMMFSAGTLFYIGLMMMYDSPILNG